MILIAHRGNTKGRNLEVENSPKYIQQALDAGYHVEVDVWLKNDKFFLGHDNPKYEIDISFLKGSKFFCHAKNIEALHAMLETPNIHCFWHEGDFCTLTSQGFVWKYPEVYFDGKIWGVCSDWL